MINQSGHHSRCGWGQGITANDDVIVIYPEIITDNPLKAKNVVRYLLNIPGKVNGRKFEGFNKNDLIISYDEKYSLDLSNQILTIHSIYENCFNYNNEEKNIEYTYWIGKGKFTYLDCLKDAIKITYSWPKSREELAEILKRTKTFVTFDDCTSLTEEARRCNCIVKCFKDNQLQESEFIKILSLEEEQEQFQNFLNLCKEKFLLE